VNFPFEHRNLSGCAPSKLANEMMHPEQLHAGPSAVKDGSDFSSVLYQSVISADGTRIKLTLNVRSPAFLDQPDGVMHFCIPYREIC
jgi:hypothetical protein